MKRHVSAVHEGKKNYKCHHCEKTFPRAGHLKTHLQNVHNKVKLQTDTIHDDHIQQLKSEGDNIKANIITKDSCLSCGKICGDKFILDCGQQPFCNPCSENILSEENGNCPACNQSVSLRIMMKRQV